jgi:hypothetical protein
VRELWLSLQPWVKQETLVWKQLKIPMFPQTFPSFSILENIITDRNIVSRDAKMVANKFRNLFRLLSELNNVFCLPEKIKNKIKIQYFSQDIILLFLPNISNN